MSADERRAYNEWLNSDPVGDAIAGDRTAAGHAWTRSSTASTSLMPRLARSTPVLTLAMAVPRGRCRPVAGCSDDVEVATPTTSAGSRPWSRLTIWPGPSTSPPARWRLGRHRRRRCAPGVGRRPGGGGRVRRDLTQPASRPRRRDALRHGPRAAAWCATGTAPSIDGAVPAVQELSALAAAADGTVFVADHDVCRSCRSAPTAGSGDCSPTRSPAR